MAEHDGCLAEIHDLTDRLAQCDRNWEEAIVERNRLRDQLAALEQAARDFLEQAAGGAVHGSSWDEFERTAERLRQVLDGTDSGEAPP
jgi:hypothetical protein